MNKPASCDKIRATVREGGWIVCPECERRHAINPNWRVNRSLLRINRETSAAALPVYCRKCQTEIKLDIADGLSFESLS